MENNDKKTLLKSPRQWDEKRKKEVKEERNEDTTCRISDGRTPLLIAAQDGMCDMVDKLCSLQKMTATDDEHNDDYTYLLKEVQYGDSGGSSGGLETAKNSATGALPEGTTAVMLAAEAGHSSMIYKLVDEIKQRLQAITDEAAKKAAMEEAFAHLQKKRHTDGMCALSLASANGHEACIRALGEAALDLSRNVSLIDAHRLNNNPVPP